MIVIQDFGVLDDTLELPWYLPEPFSGALACDTLRSLLKLGLSIILIVLALSIFLSAVFVAYLII